MCLWSNSFRSLFVGQSRSSSSIGQSEDLESIELSLLLKKDGVA